MYDINLNGEIGGDSWDGQGEFGILGTKFIQNQLADSNDDEITVHINSPGGELREGYAIHDILKNSEKQIHTIIEGICSSIATVVLLAAPKDNRKATENSTGMIHNPWKISIGNSDELQEDVDLLKKEEEKLLDFYVKETGANHSELENLMAEERELTSAELLDLGFIGSIAEDIKDLKRPNKIFAKAYITRNMKKKEESKSIKDMLEGFMSKVMNLVDKKHDDDEEKNEKAETKPRAEEQQLEDGTRIFINGDEGSWVGKEVWVIGEDGSLGNPLDDGDQKLGDGRTLRISGGTVSEVVEQMEEETADPNALKNQVIKMQAEISRLKKGQLSDGLARDLIGELNNIKGAIQSEGTPNQGGGNFTNINQPISLRGRAFEKAQEKWDKSKSNHIKN